MGNEKCVDITDKKGCERKSCTWLITDEPEDCIVDVTTTETPTIEPGCCKADSVKREEMCLARDTREKCEKSSSCVGWITGDDADCSFEETTTESPGCCYINPEMAYSKKYQAMQYQVSLSSVLLMAVAAFALYQTYAWMAARKNKDYAAVPNQSAAQYYQSA